MANNSTDVEPWTFEQHVGEAVFIPAGCPHQVRNRQVRFLWHSVGLFLISLLYGNARKLSKLVFVHDVVVVCPQLRCMFL